MRFTELKCTEFVEVLASASPVPGGGGASALVGAIGMALGNMVGSLTIGKKKYLAVQADIIALKEMASLIQTELLNLVQRDADVFEPLILAYGIPKEDPSRAPVMEDALRNACSVPLSIMENSCKAIRLQKHFAAKGTELAISDVGVGVALCKAALQGASLNVFINTKAMTDKTSAKKINDQAIAMLTEYSALADEIYADVTGRLVS